MSLEERIPDRPLLLIDDNPQNLRLAGFLLKSAGLRVQPAASAEEALDLLQRERFSLVLVDVQLPGMDGLELTRRIRATPAWAGMTVVAVTAYAMRGDEERIIAAGCNGYISKPIESRAFAGQVMEYMEKYAGTSERASGPDDSEMIANAEVALLKIEFLAQARREARALLSMPDIDLGGEPSFTTLHRWAGVGTSIGLTPVTNLAREAGCHSQQPLALRGLLIRPLIASILTFLESAI